MDNHHQRHPRREYRRRKAVCVGNSIIFQNNRLIIVFCHQNLPKHSSLPGLHLVASQQQLFHCNRCGFISTLLPLCLWCTWALNEAGRELQPSKGPTRRVSSPALLFMHVEARPSQRTQRGSTKQASAYHGPHESNSMSSYPPSVALAANVLQQDCIPRDQRKTASTSSFSLSNLGRRLGRSLSLESTEAFNSPDNGTSRSKNTPPTPSVHDSSGQSGSGQPLQPPESLAAMCASGDHVSPRRRVITNDLPDVDIPHWSDVTTATSANLIHKAEVSTKRYRPTHPPALSNPTDFPLAFAQARTPQEEVADITTNLSEDPSRSDNALCETSLSNKSSCDRVLKLKSPANFRGESNIPSHSLPSCSLSVDRSLSDSMAITTKISMRTLKATRRGFIVDYDDHKASTRPYDDNDSHSIYEDTNVFTPSHSTGSKPSSPVRSISPRPQQSGGPLRTLRRKKHLRVNVVQPYGDDTEASEPIAISLPLHAEPTSEHSQSSKTSPHVASLPPHRPVSTISLKNNNLAPLVISPMSTIEEPISTPPLPSQAKDQQSTSPSPTASSPVKLGHPSRPYYTAIRKNGISPPSSRPSSIIGPSSTSNAHIRPKSYNPPSSFHMNPSTLPSSSGARHMSMSAAFSPGMSTSFSAFSVQDDDAISDDDVPVSPPALAPARLSLTLNPGRVKRASYGNETTPKRDKRKSGRASMSAAPSVPTHGIGFSMSGETEQRMALAAASGGATESGFKYNYQSARPSAELERSPISPVSPVSAGAGSPPSAWAGGNLEGVPAGSRNSFVNRVKKLRKGLKDMLGHAPTSPC
ncbi:hypothetical protein BJ165DRAFT_1059241 [Panaeolus papilionaceus]|nr:hypothetical protein BJ165DRAFT_1059241 [Panaeolus papilionaceus]